MSYKVNKDFFKTWSPQMAWVLGIAASDGCVYWKPKKHRYQLIISMKDKDVLGKVKKAMSSEHPIKYIKYMSTWKNPKFRKMSSIYRFVIANKEICSDLIKLGITPRKSKTIEFPSVPKEFLPHFVRGIMDGDGCIHVRKRIHYPSLTVLTSFRSGSKKFIEGFATELKKLDFPFSIRRRPDGDIMQLSVKLLHWMYKDKGNYFMERKYKKYQQYLLQKFI